MLVCGRRERGERKSVQQQSCGRSGGATAASARRAAAHRGCGAPVCVSECLAGRPSEASDGCFT
eukprot:1819974-Prymnesium_polylepis.1